MTVMQSRNDLVRSVGSECSISVLAATVRKAIKRPAGAHVDPAELAPTTPGWHRREDHLGLDQRARLHAGNNRCDELAQWPRASRFAASDLTASPDPTSS